jgi:hypothetical protein
MKNNLITTMLIAGIALSCNPVKKTTNDTVLYSNPTADSSFTMAQTVADGKSFETAIVIKEKTETPGVHAEYQWIRDHYSNYKVVQQSLATHGKKPFDIITIELADNTKQEIYFDISKFFGHL